MKYLPFEKLYMKKRYILIASALKTEEKHIVHQPG